MSSDVPASLVKQLRDETGAGMMDCKNALAESDGDLEAARKLLREKGMAQAVKRQVRETSEGKVVYRLDAGRGSMVALGSETEPVAANEEFIAFANRVLDEVDRNGPEAIDSLDEERTALVARLRENIVIRGGACYEAAGDERIAVYVHPPANKIGVMVRLHGGTDELARQLAMHISFSAPRWTAQEEVTPDYLESERAIYEKLPDVAGKPEEAREKIVQGMLNKRFYAASPGGVLVDQQWIHDTSKTVRQALEESKARVVEFVRFSVSE